MPTKREREYYRMGFRDAAKLGFDAPRDESRYEELRTGRSFPTVPNIARSGNRPKRKLSAWNKYVKANSKKPRFRYKSGANKGKLNLRAMGIAFRKTPAGKKKRR